jgi:hypothetical protein
MEKNDIKVFKLSEIYTRYRAKYDVLIACIFYILGILALPFLFLWPKYLYYLIGVLITGTVCDWILLRCPHCNKRPSILKKFSAQCRYCGKVLCEVENRN